ncbi:MAG: SDR family oxidoreductase [Nitrososphaera sp.]|jgi:dTDP-4-dehydrorhamnose reductase
MKDRILIIGGSGVVGTKMINYFTLNDKDVEFTYLTHNVPYATGHILDITKKDDVIQLIQRINPDIVINTTTLNSVDMSETNHDLADLITVKGMENIVNACKITKSKIVYISTSFVFNGKKQEYVEEDIPMPDTYYGVTKFKAEELAKNSGLHYLILRTDALYCWIEEWQREKRTNSVLRAIQTIQSGKNLEEIIDWYNTPTYVPDLVYSTGLLLDCNASGVFHITGPEFMNRYEWSLQVAEMFGLDKNMIKPIHSNTLNLPAKRSNVNLNNQKLIKKIDIQMKTVKQGLHSMLKYSRP